MRMSQVIEAAGGLKAGALPEGTQFYRVDSRLNNDNEKRIAETLSRLNDLLNHSEYERLQAVSEIERLKAVGGRALPQVSAYGLTTGETPEPPSPQGVAKVLS